jgi:hypothetical protein
MLLQVSYLLVAVGFFVFLPGAALADEKSHVDSRDYFGIGLDFMSFCDFKPENRAHRR